MKTLGIKIDGLTKDEVLQKVEGFLGGKKQHYIVLPYSEFIVNAYRDEEFRQIINQADLSLCEGKGLFFVLRLLGFSLKDRIVGIDLIRDICANFDGVFLFGGREKVVSQAGKNLGNNIVGLINGYQDNSLVLEKINQVRPQILLVGLGSPRQEKWIAHNLEKMPSVKLALGVGGAFDFISGRIRRAPTFLGEAGLEWLWRFIRQPWRVRRVFKSVIVFPWLVLKTRLSTRK